MMVRSTGDHDESYRLVILMITGTIELPKGNTYHINQVREDSRSIRHTQSDFETLTRSLRS